MLLSFNSCGLMELRKGQHPHGLNYARHWLAWMLNMEPLTDVTAMLLFYFLDVSGNALMRQYHIQFWKITLSKFIQGYIPRIEAITSTVQKGMLMCLKDFMKHCLQMKEILLQIGTLLPSFWRL